MALKSNTKKTIIILSTLAAILAIGAATGVVTYVPITKSKNNTFGKSDKCFQELKKELPPAELMTIMNKRKWDQSWCDFL